MDSERLPPHDLVERLEAFETAYIFALTRYREARSAGNLEAVETVETSFDEWLHSARSALAQEYSTHVLPEVNWWLTRIDQERQRRTRQRPRPR